MDFFSSVFENQSEISDNESQFCFFKQDDPSKPSDTSSNYMDISTSQQIDSSQPNDNFILPISTQSQTNFMNTLFNQPQPQQSDPSPDTSDVIVNLNSGNILDNFNSVKNLFSSKNNNNPSSNNNSNANSNSNVNGNINQNIQINISSQGSFPGVEIYAQRNDVIPENENEEEDENGVNKGNNKGSKSNMNESYGLPTFMQQASTKEEKVNNSTKGMEGNCGNVDMPDFFGGFENKKPNSKMSGISSASFGLVKKKVLDENDEQEFIIKEKKIENKSIQQQNLTRNNYSTNKTTPMMISNQNNKRTNKPQMSQQQNQQIDNSNNNDIFNQVNTTIIQNPSKKNTNTSNIDNNNNNNIITEYSKLMKLFSSKQSQSKTLKPLMPLFEQLYITTEDFKLSFPPLIKHYLSSYYQTLSQMNALFTVDDPELDSLLTQCEHKLSHLTDKFSEI